MTGGNCRVHKRRLLNLAGVKPKDQVLVRIVCQELEGWFLGDLAAVCKAYPEAARSLKASRRKYPEPDEMTNASDELRLLTKAPGKVGRAKAISRYMNIENNRSRSFQVFVAGLRRLAETPAPE